jgi:hypothetical protein
MSHMSSWEELSLIVSEPSVEFMLTPPSSPEGGGDGTRTPTYEQPQLLPSQPVASDGGQPMGPLALAQREIIWSLADLEKRTGLKLVKTSGYKYCCLSFSDLMAKGVLDPGIKSQKSR